MQALGSPRGSRSRALRGPSGEHLADQTTDGTGDRGARRAEAKHRRGHVAEKVRDQDADEGADTTRHGAAAGGGTDNITILVGRTKRKHTED